MKIIFKKPYKFDDKEYKWVELDLDGLRGRDITDAYRQYAAAGNFSPMIATDPNFCFRIAAMASAQPFEFYDDLPAADFMYVVQTVQNFLLSSGLVNQDPTATSEKPALH